MSEASTSLIYRSARGYEWLMRALYGRHYGARMRMVAERVPDGASVLELCCGPGTLYLRHLQGRVSGYTGLDVNAGFVARLRARGVDARVVDLTVPVEPLPTADVAIIQASLYHFLPDAAALLERMLVAARRRVIVAEPVRNLTSSRITVVAGLGRRGADPGVGGHAQRFDESSLAALMERYRDRTEETLAIPGGRERIYVLAAGGPAPA
ncbi:MAG: class I SAM-dependent methyltransferase [Actinomycetota bacterium]|nr:class I SAM-dependent methyltransferase [Actinomycetota bacterium]